LSEEVAPEQADTAPADVRAWLEHGAIENVRRSKRGSEKTQAIRLAAEITGVLKSQPGVKPEKVKSPDEMSDVEKAREIAFVLARGVNLQGLQEIKSAPSLPKPKPEPKPEPEPKKSLEEYFAEADARETEETGLKAWEREELARLEARIMKPQDRRQQRANVAHANSKPRRRRA
jgi:DNA-binding transcriptional MerR regulator